MPSLSYLSCAARNTWWIIRQPSRRACAGKEERGRKEKRARPPAPPPPPLGYAYVSKAGESITIRTVRIRLEKRKSTGARYRRRLAPDRNRRPFSSEDAWESHDSTRVPKLTRPDRRLTRTTKEGDGGSAKGADEPYRDATRAREAMVSRSRKGRTKGREVRSGGSRSELAEEASPPPDIDARV
ncbi:hypothetical protein KM043_010505 [Ampulex compressa]|nr:hypothetical protein KM043_010505 [Ampulex compressa]